MNQPQRAAQRALRHHRLRLLAAGRCRDGLVAHLDGLLHVHAEHVTQEETLGILAIGTQDVAIIGDHFVEDGLAGIAHA